MSERPTEETVERERLEWRCFHCGELFTDERRAGEHFGWNESKTPACIIKGSEGGLVRALREVEREYAELLLRLGEETNEAAKAHYAYVSRQHMAVQNAEEVGYARGLADGRAPSERVQGGEAERLLIGFASPGSLESPWRGDGPLMIHVQPHEGDVPIYTDRAALSTTPEEK